MTAKLIYTAITSLDGYVADEDGGFAWAEPDEAVHGYVNDLERAIGTHLYGRRMYEVMVYWETAGTAPDEPAVERKYASIWQSAEKVVFSTTLEEPSSARTQIERSFDPDGVRSMKTSATRDLSVSGPHLAAQALAAGLVDEVRLFVSPVVVGGGTPALPDGLRLDLELLEEHRFENGVVHLRYGIGER